MRVVHKKRTNRRKVPTQPTTKTIPHTKAHQKDPLIPRPYHQQTYQKKNTPTFEFLCVTSLAQRCRRRRSVRTTRSRHFMASSCLRTARPQRCLTSCRGHSASSHSAQKLGEALACGTAVSWTARPCGDRRQTQTGPLVVLPTLSSEPCLLGRTLSVTPE